MANTMQVVLVLVVGATMAAAAGARTQPAQVNYLKLGPVGVGQLVTLAGRVQPGSCWCASLPSAALCPLSLAPFHHVRQVLGVRCEGKEAHCCQRRVDSGGLVPPANLTTAAHLKSFLGTLASTLEPRRSERDDSDKNDGRSKESDEERTEGQRKATPSDAQPGNRRKHSSSTIAPKTDPTILTALKELAHLLLSQKGKAVNISPSLQTLNIFRSKRSHLHDGTDLSQPTVEAGNGGVVNKVVPYHDLGWFSKAVEVAMDGSLYVGVALAVLLGAGALLSGALSLFGDTCIVCSLIGYSSLESIS